MKSDIWIAWQEKFFVEIIMKKVAVLILTNQAFKPERPRTWGTEISIFTWRSSCFKATGESNLSRQRFFFRLISLERSFEQWQKWKLNFEWEITLQ